MEQRYLGRSGLCVSTLSLGTMTWGQETGEETAAGILAAYVEAGGTVIDTAASYGHGEAEEIAGSLLAALEYAVRSGRARYVGISNYAGWQLAHAASISPVPLTAVQTEYSLLQRGAEREIIPAAAALGLGVLAWSPLGRGVLTGKYKDQIPAGSRAASEQWASFVQKYLQGRPVRITEALITAARGLDRPALDMALGWAVTRPGIDSAVIGPRTVDQLTALLNARLDQVPQEILAALTDASGLN